MLQYFVCNILSNLLITFIRHLFCTLVEQFVLVCFNINKISYSYKISGIFLLQCIRQNATFDFSEAVHSPVAKANKIINPEVSRENFGTEQQACHSKTRGQVIP